MEPDGHPHGLRAAMPAGQGYREHRIRRGRHHLHAREYPGQEPAIVLLHGFPDDLHLYDRLVPRPAEAGIGRAGRPRRLRPSGDRLGP
jgi:hypothetical protein